MVRAISDNNDSIPKHSEFTPISATRTLPLVRRIVDDMMRLTESIETQREPLRVIDDLPETIDHYVYQRLGGMAEGEPASIP